MVCQSELVFKKEQLLLGFLDDVADTLSCHALALCDLGKRQVFIIVKVEKCARLFVEHISVKVKKKGDIHIFLEHLMPLTLTVKQNTLQSIT